MAGRAEGRKMTGLIPEIKERIAVADVLADAGVTLTRGRAACPLHGGKNSTAFSVRGDRWTCFACGEKGDAIDLYANLHGLDTRTAIRRLAARAGLSYGPMTPSERAAMQRARRERERRAALKKRFKEWCHAHELETARVLRTLRKIKDEWTDFTQKGREGLALIQVEIDYAAYLYEVLCNDESARLTLYKERKA